MAKTGRISCGRDGRVHWHAVIIIWQLLLLKIIIDLLLNCLRHRVFVSQMAAGRLGVQRLQALGSGADDDLELDTQGQPSSDTVTSSISSRMIQIICATYVVC